MLCVRAALGAACSPGFVSAGCLTSLQTDLDWASSPPPQRPPSCLGFSSQRALPYDPPKRLWRCPQPAFSYRRTASGTCCLSAAVRVLSDGCVLSHSGGAMPLLASPSFSKTRGAMVGS